MRGTDIENDSYRDALNADIRDVTSLGVAVQQAVALVNWINWLRASKDTAVPILEVPGNLAMGAIAALDEIHARRALRDLIAGLSVSYQTKKDDPLLRPGDAVTITGHSLGGHLALVAARLFPGLFDQAVTFNAPGLDAGYGLSETFFSAMAATGVLDAPADGFEGLRLFNYQGDGSAPGDDLDVIADLGTMPGGIRKVAIEVSTHSMNEMLDSLGVHALLERIAGERLTLGVSNALLAAASNQEGDSTERLVDALSRLLLPEDSAPLPVGHGSYPFGSVDFPIRTALHARLLALQGVVDAHPGLQLRSLVGMTAPDLADLAAKPGTKGLPYRYALQHGIPFTVLGKDDAATAALYAPHDAGHLLDLYDPATRTGLSDTWIEDRARLLVQAIRRNLVDSTLVAGGLYHNEEYDDLARGVHFATADVSHFGPGRAPNARQYVFGTGQADTLVGGDRDDHLYGMGGDDVLQGGAGNDYLEGGQGQDLYRFEADDGLDTLFDSDGRGRVEIDGKALDGGRKVAEGLWRSEDGEHHYVLDGDTLYIDQRLRVEQFHNGDLGITLSDVMASRPQGNRYWGTSESEVLSWEGLCPDTGCEPKWYYVDGRWQHWDGLPVELFSGDGNDLLVATDAGDWLVGGDGGDWLEAGKGNDLVEGGNGDDLIFPMKGGDAAIGGDGNDVVADASTGFFDTTGTDVDDRRAWVALNGAFPHHLGETLFRDEDGEVAADFTIQVPQQPLDVMINGERYHYEPKDLEHGIWEFYFAEPIPYEISFPLFHTPDTDPNWFFGGEGDDYLEGNAGSDLLSGGADDDWVQGGAGGDILLGGPGADKIMGQQGDDLIEGGQGSDQVYGGSGRDVMHGGDGDDTLAGDNDVEGQGDADILLGEAGNDFLSGNGGDDRLVGGDGGDTLRGQAGDDLLQGGDGSDLLRGGDGNDLLFGGSGERDWLYGGDGNDRLFGGPGIDQLEGGQGDDWLDGGADGVTDWMAGGGGSDRFVFHSNGGVDIVEDATDEDRILFPEFSVEELSVNTGRSTSGEEVLILRVDQNNALIVLNGITDGPGSYEFSDGSRLSRSELLARMATPFSYQLQMAGDLSGGTADDTLVGSMGSDRIFGHGGDDVLAGYGGDDYLAGGKGRDRYLVGVGTGQDRIDEAAGQVSVLELLPGVDLSELRYQRIGDDLYIDLASGRDGVTLKGFFDRDPVWTLRDAAGRELVVTPSSVPTDLRWAGAARTLADIRSNFVQTIENSYINILRLYGYRLGDDGKWHGEFSAGNTPYEMATQHRRYTVLFDRLNVTQPSGDYERSFPALETTWVNTTMVDRPTTITLYAPGGDLVEGDFLSASFVDLDSLPGLGASGMTFTGNAIPVPAAEPTYNPLTGEMESPISGYMLYPDGGGSISSRNSIETHTYHDFEAHLNLLDLTLGDGDDRFTAARNRVFNLVDGGAGDDWLDAGGGDGRWSRPSASIALPKHGASWPLSQLPGSLLYGNTGDDHLIGSDGEDELIGGPGNDFLQGGRGGDTYRVARHGVDIVYEDGGSSSGSDRLVLPESVTAGELSYRLGTMLAGNLVVDGSWTDRLTSLHATLSLFWGTDDGVTLILPHSDQGAGLGIDSVVFGDGRAVALEDLLQQAGFDGNLDPHLESNDLQGGQFLAGYAGDDRLVAVPVEQPITIGHFSRYDAVLIGGKGHDHLVGSDGDDLLLGGEIVKDLSRDVLRATGSLWDEGNVFDGGGGDDEIWTTAGSDTLLFGVGDGNDRVLDRLHANVFLGRGEGGSVSRDSGSLTPDQERVLDGNRDTLRFKPGITPDDIRLLGGGGGPHLTLQHRNGNDSIRFEHWFDVGRNQLDRVEFDNGYFWDRADLDALLKGEPANQAPVASAALDELPAAIAGASLEITLPDLFSDPEGAAISYTLEQSDKGGLPNWLSFDADTRTLRGTPPQNAVGTVDLTLVARDDRGKTGRLQFGLTIGAMQHPNPGNPPSGGPPAGTTAGGGAVPSIPIPMNPPPAAPRPGGNADSDQAAEVPEQVSSPMPVPMSQGVPMDAVGRPRPLRGTIRFQSGNSSEQPSSLQTPSLKDDMPAEGRWTAVPSAQGLAEPLTEDQEIAARWQGLRRAVEAMDDQWRQSNARSRGVAQGAAVQQDWTLVQVSLPVMVANGPSVVGLGSGPLVQFKGLTEGFYASSL